MEDRKTQILKLSNNLLQRLGYDSFSYADLSKELGITKASIHHHFPKKDDLGLELCYFLKNNMKEIFENILNLESSALDKLQMYIDLYSNFTDDGDKVCPISSLQAEANIISKEMRKEVLIIDDMEMNFVLKILKDAESEGSIQVVGSSESQAMLIASSLKGILQYSRMHGRNYYDKITTQLMIQLKK